MREINLTGGQESMKNLLVKTTPTVVDRLNVFRSTPFEFDLTALPITATAIVGSPRVVDTRLTPTIRQNIENSSALPGPSSSTNGDWY